MKGNIDKIIKDALRTSESPTRDIEKAVVQKMAQKWDSVKEEENTKFLIGQRSLFRHQLRYVTKNIGKVAAIALCAIVILCGATTTIAAVKGVDIGKFLDENGVNLGQLVGKIWTVEVDSESNVEGEKKKEDTSQEESGLTALEKISSGVEILKENSTFNNIIIEPVLAINDKYSIYVVLKVKGNNKVELGDNTAFGFDNAKGDWDSLGSYVLSREGNTMYYAVKLTYLKGQKEEYGEYTVSVKNLVYAEIDENGIMGKIKTDKNGNDMIVEEGEYKIKLRCKVSDKETQLKIKDNIQVKVTTLNAYFNGDIFEGKVDKKQWKVINEAFILMEDGSKVEALYAGGLVGKYNLCELETPIDPDSVIGIEFHGKKYYKE